MNADAQVDVQRGEARLQDSTGEHQVGSGFNRTSFS